MTHENHNDPMPAIMARLATAQCERLRRATEDAGEVIRRVSDFLDGNRDIETSFETHKSKEDTDGIEKHI